MSTIITRNSATSGSSPSSLVQGELAINVTDNRLFFGSGSGNVVKEFGATASYAIQALSSSYATTASYVQNAQTASYVLQAVSASYATTASYVQNAQSASYVLSASYASTASYVENAQTASYVLQAVSASYASTASYVENAQTSSYVLSASYAQTASYAPAYLPLTGGTIDGNVTINGTASITFLNVTYESASVIYSSGSNQFGDASNDVQTLWGTVDIKSGPVLVTGSVIANSFTGSLLGTASYTTQALSASYANTASYVENAQTASYVLSASYAISSSYAITASHALNALTASFITASNVYGPYGSNSVISASYAQTASYAQNIIISGSINNVDYIDFNTGSSEPAWKSGRVYWNNTDGALSVYNAEADISLQVGQENWVRAYNASGVLITNGTAVRLVGSHGDSPEIQLARSIQVSGSVTRDNQILGIATHDIEINSFGFITTQGLVKGLNTSAFLDGDRLYVSSSAGKLTKTPPTAPYEIIPAGIVVKASPGGSGIIYADPQQPIDFTDLSSVEIGDYAYGDIFTYIKSGSIGVWKHTNQLSGSYGVTGSWSATSFTGSLLGTASYATQALSSSYATTSSYVLNAVSASYVQNAQSASYVLQAVSASFATTASYYGGSVTSASFASTASYVNPLRQTVQVTGSLNVTGSVYINNALYSNQTNTLATENKILYSIPTSTYDALFVEYIAKNGSNARAGQIMSATDGTSVKYTETTTTDIGSTSPITFAVSVAGGNIQLEASASTSTWTIKTITRAI